MRKLEDGSIAVGLFNRDSTEQKVTASWTDLGIGGKQYLRDLWRQKDIGRYSDKFTAKVPARGVMMLKIRPA
jgi:alpha-galactosidase